MKIDRVCDFIRKAENKFEAYGNFRPTPVNLRNLVNFGQNAPASESFKFLKSELPVRIANSLQEFRLLPENLLKTDSVLKVARMYDETFETLLNYEKCDRPKLSVISKFTDDLHDIAEKLSDVVAYMASGIREMKENGAYSSEEDKQLHYFLDRFYISRIGIRTLITQHTLIYGTSLRLNDSFIGCIDPECSPLRLAISAYSYARLLCTRVYGRAPGCRIEVVDSLESGKRARLRLPSSELHVTVDSEGKPSGSSHLFDQQPSCADLEIVGPNVTFCYIPGHLFHMLFELSKNAMRAVTEHWPSDSALPKVNILICCGHEDVTIKISDEGGGMARNVVSQAFKYTFTTASHLVPLSSPISDCYSQGCETDGSRSSSRVGGDPEGAKFSPLAGRGHGLPLSRLYAHYLSGDLNLVSIEGHGSSAFIHLKRLPEEASELVPIFNRTSKAVYQCRASDHDWVSGGDLYNGNPSVHDALSS